MGCRRKHRKYTVTTAKCKTLVQPAHRRWLAAGYSAASDDATDRPANSMSWSILKARGPISSSSIAIASSWRLRRRNKSQNLMRCDVVVGCPGSSKFCSRDLPKTCLKCHTVACVVMARLQRARRPRMGSCKGQAKASGALLHTLILRSASSMTVRQTQDDACAVRSSARGCYCKSGGRKHAGSTAPFADRSSTHKKIPHAEALTDRLCLPW